MYSYLFFIGTYSEEEPMPSTKEQPALSTKQIKKQQNMYTKKRKHGVDQHTELTKLLKRREEQRQRDIQILLNLIPQWKYLGDILKHC